MYIVHISLFLAAGWGNMIYMYINVEKEERRSCE
jgi:hypothetical protein